MQDVVQDQVIRARVLMGQWPAIEQGNVCGTHLYYRLIPADDYILSLGLFQDGPEFQFQEQIVIDRKPRSHDLAKYAPG